jgi:hypothetical protein
MQKEMHELLRSTLGEKTSLRLEDGNLLFWIEHEDLQNTPSAQYRLKLAKKDDTKYYETFAFAELEDGFHAYRFNDEVKDDEEVPLSDLEAIKSQLSHALLEGSLIKT